MINFDALKWDAQGLIPAVVQDARTGQVLMLAYMNADSLRRTLEEGETVFWSRSRTELWHKGATSGNTQTVREIRVDCDGDTLLILVDPAGPACHTGEVSCFYRPLSALTNATEDSHA
jgi:phosphoribosyl-ATP pyrophosphohydrolase/phosphoribosyl-AMP cyclohydrolase